MEAVGTAEWQNSISLVIDGSTTVSLTKEEFTMEDYLFTVPLVAGKTETWKKYMKKMTNP